MSMSSPDPRFNPTRFLCVVNLHAKPSHEWTRTADARGMATSNVTLQMLRQGRLHMIPCESLALRAVSGMT